MAEAEGLVLREGREVDGEHADAPRLGLGPVGGGGRWGEGRRHVVHVVDLLYVCGWVWRSV